MPASSTASKVPAYNSGAMKGAERFAEEYRSCWGMKTAYKDYESARPRTTSRNKSVRILLLFMPIFMYIYVNSPRAYPGFASSLSRWVRFLPS